MQAPYFTEIRTWTKYLPLVTINALLLSTVPTADVGRYSRTSHNGPSEKRTTSLQQTNAVLRIKITIVLIHK